jgi:hypothetical protein
MIQRYKWQYSCSKRIRRQVRMSGVDHKFLPVFQGGVSAGSKQHGSKGVPFRRRSLIRVL